MSYCHCSKLNYVHAHCPCYNCNEKAVSRATEYRHWEEANLEDQCDANAQIILGMDNTTMDNTTMDMDNITVGAELSSTCVDYTGEVDESVFVSEATVDHTCTNTDLSTAPPDINDDEVQLQSIDKTTNTSICQSKFGQNMDNDIAVAVLRAFKIIDEMGGSQKNLIQVLNFARDCYCKGDLKMSEKWPNSRSACMRTLKDAGYKEPKLNIFP